MEENKDKKWRREKEDATKYGEFISSYFAWKTLEEQKERLRIKKTGLTYVRPVFLIGKTLFVHKRGLRWKFITWF